MAERRMFAKTIIDSDAFLDMPLSTQALYFHLSMRADDEGFINNPKKIQRMIGASDDDLKILITKSFLIPFESGIVVVKHWRIHNYIQSDRFKKTVYTEERQQLSVKDNKAYTLNEQPCIQDVYITDTQVSIGKDSIVKDKDNKGKKPKAFTPPTLEEIQAYIKERGSNVDAKRFFDYYEQGGWKDSSGKPVRNWKQKMIAVWEKDKPAQPKPQNSFCNFKQNEIDYDELAKKIYAN